MKTESIFKKYTFLLLCTALLSAAMTFQSCTQQKQKSEDANKTESKAESAQKGIIVSFPEGSQSLNFIETQEVKLGSSMVSVKAPSRVVATVSTAVSSKDKIILFDSPEVTSLYSQYRQTKANINLYTKNLQRIKEMFDNLATTARELNQAENDLNLALTTLSELEGRLRTFGFNPVEFDHASLSTVWLISDVPEGQLMEVQKGEEVDITFNAFPEILLKGHVSSIGDMIDAVTRTTRVRITMNNYKGKLIPGMYALIDFGDTINNVVALPTNSIVTVDGKDYVFTEKEKGVFERKAVIAKKSASDIVIITNGLSNGDKVVVKGAMLLKGISFGY